LHYAVAMWHWIQLNSGAVQSVAAVIGAVIGFLTVPVLLMTYFAARDAAAAARQQAEAARALTEVSKAQQVATERAAIAAEAQVESAVASSALAREQLVAFQQSAAAERDQTELTRQRTLASLRPLLHFQIQTANRGSWLVLVNVSGALALSVEVFNGTPDLPGTEVRIPYPTMAPGAEMTLEGVDWRTEFVAGRSRTLGPVPIFARFRSQDGRQFTTVVEDLNRKPITQVDREDLVNPQLRQD
jgi:hypothetical protein